MEEQPGTTATESEVTRLLPISNGRFGMWLFISTEVMLFAGIFASYLVLRFATLREGWPAPSLLHVSPAVGVMNTVILVLSGVTIWNATKASRAKRPATAKLWLMATVFLGVAFLCVKGLEFHKKYELGLMPNAHRKQIFDEPDYHYLAAVDRRMNEKIQQVERQRDRNPDQFDEQAQSELDSLYDLQTYFTAWTVRTVGRLNNSYQEQLAIRLLAYLIYWHPDSERGLDTFLKDERESLAQAQVNINLRKGLAERRLLLVNRQVADLEQEIEQTKLLESSLAGESDEDLEKKAEWLSVKQEQQEELNSEIDLLDNQLIRVGGRLDWTAKLVEMDDGLNHQMDLKLPVVLTNGHQWMSTYLLITGFHALHVLGGLIALLWFLPRRLDDSVAPRLYVTAMYWQFVDFVWLGIFVLIYF